MDLIRFICGYYNAYRDILGLDHENAMHKTELTYDDLHDWIYEKGEYKNKNIK